MSQEKLGINDSICGSAGNKECLNEGIDASVVLPQKCYINILYYIFVELKKR